MFGLGVQELLLILVIVLIFFGADKIPQLAKSLGKGMSEFRKAQQDLKEEIAGEVVPEPVPGSAVTSEAVELKPTYVVCPACQGKTVANSLHCASCGKPMTHQPVCGVCQRPFMENEKFCPNCGQPRVDTNA